MLDEQLPAEVDRLLASGTCRPSALGFELTEAAIQVDPDKAGNVLRDLSDRGMRLGLDDFGTGYSSLAVLRDLPIREIKIDRSFINGLTTSAADETIVRSTVGLAHDLDLSVIAEGVEDEDTLRHLAELGCDEAQGYYFSAARARHAAGVVRAAGHRRRSAAPGRGAAHPGAGARVDPLDLDARVASWPPAAPCSWRWRSPPTAGRTSSRRRPTAAT